MSSQNDTIFARASGPPRAGVSVFRVSGPRAHDIAKALGAGATAPKRAALRSLRDKGGDLIDEGLVILFRAPASFTGEDVAEFHLHGSPAVESALYEALSGLGARPAEAGEFTKRALLNGKLDLAEVEGLADLLDAETSWQRKQALGQFSGRLSAVAEAWRNRLIAILVPLEAGIDFPDEADVPAEIAEMAAPAIDALLAELRRYRDASGKARAIREGVKVAIIGAPNAGKSSLLNRLAGSDRAIVSETPGTTRDVIEVRLDLSGMLVSLFDTAGLREATGDPVEAEGMRRTRMNAEEADIRLLVVDAAAPEKSGEELLRGGDFVVSNKIDLLFGNGGPPPSVASLLTPPPQAGEEGARDEGSPPPQSGGGVADGDGGGSLRASPAPDGVRRFRISAKTGEGIAALLSVLSAAVAERGQGEGALLSRARHTAAVEAAIGHLEAAKARLGEPDLAAEDVRLAARSLGRITGAVGVEDVLGAIFSSFCIGK